MPYTVVATPNASCCPLRRSLCMHRDADSRRGTWNGKRKGGARPLVPLCPQTTIVPLDDRAADEQSDSHPAALRGVERIEQRVQRLRRGADAGVADAQTDAV